MLRPESMKNLSIRAVQHIGAAALTAALLLAIASSYVFAEQAPPGTGLPPTLGWSIPAHKSQWSGQPKCDACPHNAACASMVPPNVPNQTVMIGTAGSASACLLNRYNGYGTGYQSVRDACKAGNIYLYRWDDEGDALNCNLGGQQRIEYEYYYSNGQHETRERLLAPACVSKVDSLGASWLGLDSQPSSIRDVFLESTTAWTWGGEDEASIAMRAWPLYGSECFMGFGTTQTGYQLGHWPHTLPLNSGMSPIAQSIRSGFCTTGGVRNPNVMKVSNALSYMQPIWRHSCMKQYPIH